MEKKRSAAVTIIAWIFILTGIQWLTSINSYSKVYGAGLSTFSVVVAILTFACGVFLLRLHPVARKLAIFLSLIALLSIPVYFVPFSKAMNSENVYAKKKQAIMESMKPDYQEKALQRLDRIKEIWTKNVAPIILICVFGSIALCNLFFIYFFTRPKVKEQFS